MTWNTTLLALALTPAFLTSVPRPTATPHVPPAAGAPAEKAAPASLAGALEDFVARVEADDVDKAAAWAGGEPAAGRVKAQWEALKRNHKTYDYRKWIDGRVAGGAAANAVGDGKTFTVGGHEFGHLHLVWSKTDAGWRVSDVWLCR